MPLTTAVVVRQRNPEPLIARRFAAAGMWIVQRVTADGPETVELLSDRLFQKRYEVTSPAWMGGDS